MLATMLRVLAAGKGGEDADLDDSGEGNLSSETSWCQHLVVRPS